MDYTDNVAGASLVTIVETPEFLRRADRLMTDEARDALVAYLSTHPTAGNLIQGTGGVRKFRWGLEGRGTRGGARVIYFYHSANMPLFALTVFAKNERSDLTQADRNDLRGLTKALVETYRRTKP